VVREMLTNSDNNTAEMLLKELGFADSGRGTRFAGLTVLDRTLLSWGIPLDGVRLLDGSGLTPTNQVSCAALLGVLQRSKGTALATGLPIAAQTGTLRDEFVGTDIAGRLFAKTGTLGNPPSDEPPLASKALAGYVSGGNGSTIEFALILNETEIGEDVYRLFWALFSERFATFPDGPARDQLTPL
jgi:D-alanyl-D-alanine carboxypeptidase/D-alanyl-D-alanine-endopeptidase (penicillin-binding protein 4)